MLRSSSSTFSSELVRSKRLNDFTQLKRYVLGIVLWTIGALVLFDAVVGLAFRQPSDPRQASSSLQTYFDYGRSIEGKLRRLVGSTPEQDAPIVEAGWLAHDCDIATPPPPGKLAFDIYGMSHSAQLAEQMLRLDSRACRPQLRRPRCASQPQLCLLCPSGRSKARTSTRPDFRLAGITNSTAGDNQRAYH